MSSTVETKLNELGITVPDAPAPAANYVPAGAGASGTVMPSSLSLVSTVLDMNISIKNLGLFE